MDRISLISALNSYKTSFHEEKEFLPRFRSLLINFPNCYDRSLVTGHMTGSAWIINEKGDAALLVHHKKLSKWLQPGGHADGDENIISVASNEAFEETGLNSLRLFNRKIFDIDIHLIPAYGTTPAHYHHDIRFLFVADKTECFTVSHESNELAWISINDINQYARQNRSIHRMVSKTNLIFN